MVDLLFFAPVAAPFVAACKLQHRVQVARGRTLALRGFAAVPAPAAFLARGFRAAAGLPAPVADFGASWTAERCSEARESVGAHETTGATVGATARESARRRSAVTARGAIVGALRTRTRALSQQRGARWRALVKSTVETL